MLELVARIEALDAVVWLRRSVWGYAVVNGTHILGIAMLVGSMINVDLRMTGLWRGEHWREGMRQSLPVARAGFAVAVVTGLLLFSVRAGRYLENPAFLVKMAVLTAAMMNVVLFYTIFFREERTLAMRLAGLVSLIAWITVLAAGRAIGFV